MDKTIQEIINYAFFWLKDHDEGSDPLPSGWEQAIALMKAAPDLREACKAVVEAFDDSDIISATHLCRYALAKIPEPEPCQP